MGFTIFLRSNDYVKAVSLGQSYCFIVFMSSIHQEIIIIFLMYGFNQFLPSVTSWKLPGDEWKATEHDAIQYKCSFVVSSLFNIQCSVLDYLDSCLHLDLRIYLYTCAINEEYGISFIRQCSHKKASRK